MVSLFLRLVTDKAPTVFLASPQPPEKSGQALSTPKAHRQERGKKTELEQTLFQKEMGQEERILLKEVVKLFTSFKAYNMSGKQIISYKGADKFINGFIETTFYYRLAVVFVCFLLIGSVILRIYLCYGDERLKTMAVVFSCGSVVIGIFIPY